MSADAGVDLLARWAEPPWRDVRTAVLARGALATKDLRGIDLRGADLAGLHLPGVALDLARLDRANLAGAVLDAVSLASTTATEASFARARLRGASILASNLAGADLHEADLSDATVRDTILAGADLRAAVLRGATLGANDLGGAWTWGVVRDVLENRIATIAELLGSGLYLKLMSNPTELAARAVEGVAWGTLDLDAEVVAAIEQENWRPTVVGCSLACLATDRIVSIDRVREAAWKTLARGSWASPQLAATCALLDPSFATRARGLLESLPATRDTKRRAAVGHFLGVHIDDPDRGDLIAQRWRARIESLAMAAARARWARPR